MRHLISIVLGVIFAPLIYVLAGVADTKLVNYVEHHDRGVVGLLVGFGCVAAAGGLYAVLVLARLSPVGTVLAGLILVGAVTWHILNSRFDTLLPASVVGVHGALQAAATPTLMIAAVPLLCTVFSPRRWRSRAQSDEASDETVAPSYTTDTLPAPAYEPSGVYTPSYSTPTYTPYSSTYSNSGDTTIGNPRLE